MTSDTDQTEPATERTTGLRDLIAGARVVLWDFDGPICRLFAGYPADRVAGRLVGWLEGVGLKELLTEEEQVHPDPHVLLRAVDRRHHRSDLVAEFEERLTHEELRAVPGAYPTAYADPLIRTWAALGVGLAVTTNNSPRVVGEYLTTRGLLGCFAPHIYGRTRDLRLLKPDPYCLNRALGALDAVPAHALMVGDTDSDLAAARGAGVPFLGYARNEEKEELLKAAGAETVVRSLEPVLRLVRESGGDRAHA
ncbi:HAD family hydrolase [Streptomyces sp. NPDC093586]|uniref:HAD family hydrolase n=1 Tax=Streptomyces sp. NPDC093586 TaxID=3366042 RepID=UPI00381A926C